MFIYLFIINVFIKVFLLSPAILKTILYISRAIHEDPIKMEVNENKSMYEGNQLKMDINQEKTLHVFCILANYLAYQAKCIKRFMLIFKKLASNVW